MSSIPLKTVTFYKKIHLELNILKSMIIKGIFICCLSQTYCACSAKNGMHFVQCAALLCNIVQYPPQTMCSPETCLSHLLVWSK